MQTQDFTRYREKGAYHWSLFESRPLDRVRRFRPRLAARYDIAVRTLAKHDCLGEEGLDVGCGDGAGLYSIHLAGGRCIGIDGDETAIALAREQGLSRGVALEVKLGNVFSLPFADHRFGYAISLDVIEHLEQPVAALREMKRVVRPGGLVVLTTPMELVPGQVADRFHVREYTIESLSELLAQVFDKAEVKGYAPRPLLSMYGAPRARVDKRGIWWSLKLASAAGFNPLSRITGKRSEWFGDLVAVCRV